MPSTDDLFGRLDFDRDTGRQEKTVYEHWQ